MSGRVPKNYEESKQWIDVFNQSDDDIAPFCPCILSRGISGTTPGTGLGVLEVQSLKQFERFEKETGYYSDTQGTVQVAVCGPVGIPKKKHGRVSRDYPLIAKVDGDKTPLSELSARPIFPNSSGFRAFKTRLSETRYYWRKQLQFVLLTYLKDEKSGLCWVDEVVVGDETPLRLLSFVIRPIASLEAGYRRLECVTSQQSDDSIVSLVNGEFQFWSLGRYELFLNFQLRGSGNLATGNKVPGGSFGMVGEFVPQSVPGGNVRVLELNTPNVMGFSRSIGAGIESITHSGGSYDCSQVVMGFANPLEYLSFSRTFSLRYEPNNTAGETPGALGRKLAAKLKLYGSWVLNNEQPLDLDLNTGHGYIVLRAETNLI